ncbi:MAG: amidohydrolase family protein, partial [Acidobacteria bacterium]|nr:amidohydrolase family protein [Acidobacteriota bacterium]
KNWHRLDAALERIEAAHRSGLDINMDAYPYLAGSCSLLQFLPKWCQDGGAAGLLRELSDPQKFDRIAKETDDGMANTWDDIIICGVRHDSARGLIGKSIQRIAEDRGLTPPITAMTLIQEQDGDVFIISFNNNEDNLRKVLTHPLNSVITDGFVLEDGLSHPRTFGTYPKFLGEYVRDKRWLPMEAAIVKTSAQAARRFRFQDRGVIAPGKLADLAVFDYAKIGTLADYSDPARDPEGIRHVIVNGKFGVRDGRLTGEAAGRGLRHHV